MTCYMCGNEHTNDQYCSDECANEAVRISEFNAMSFKGIKHGFTIIRGSDTWVDPVVIQKPKPKPKQKVLDLETTLSIFDEVHNRHMTTRGRVNWGKEPAAVLMELLSKAFPVGDTYAITYNDASQIIEKARSSKMGGGFNCGIDEIKQAWQKNYIGEI